MDEKTVSLDEMRELIIKEISDQIIIQYSSLDIVRFLEIRKLKIRIDFIKLVKHGFTKPTAISILSKKVFVSSTKKKYRFSGRQVERIVRLVKV